MANQWTADADTYAAAADFVPALGADVLALLEPRPGERILDLGCGEGSLTQRLVDAGAEVVAVDADPTMVTATRARGIDAHRASATDLAALADASFDAVFSNAVLHWVRPPELAAAEMARVLRPGGRAVVEFGGHTNVSTVRVALRAAADEVGIATSVPDWFFPTPSAYVALLQAAGFVDVEAALIGRPTPVPAGVAAWLDTFAVGMAEGLAVDVWPAIRDATVERLRPVLCDDEGRWTVDYVRIRASAVRR